MIEYKNILFCTDFSEDAEIAFLHALDLARKHQAKLHIFHVAHRPIGNDRQPVAQRFEPMEHLGHARDQLG